MENASEGYNSAPSLRAAGSASLWLPVEGPGTLRFAWKTALTLSLSGAACYVDGVQAAIATSGSMPWQEAAVAVPPGWHRVQWVSRSYSTTSLDDLRWQPGTANRPGLKRNPLRAKLWV